MTRSGNRSTQIRTEAPIQPLQSSGGEQAASPCFTPGTLIATAVGEVAVEDLRPGDRVVTRDNGLQPIRWVGRKKLSWTDLALNAHLKPILLTKGSLGNGLPEQDMMLSPNHRVLMANDRTVTLFKEREVLVAAKLLTGLRGLYPVDAAGVEYLHFMFDRHQIVLSNGAWTESFQPSDGSLRGIGNAQRSEILDVFPELASKEGLEGYKPARRILGRREATSLVR